MTLSCGEGEGGILQASHSLGRTAGGSGPNSTKWDGGLPGSFSTIPALEVTPLWPALERWNWRELSQDWWVWVIMSSRILQEQVGQALSWYSFIRMILPCTGGWVDNIMRSLPALLFYDIHQPPMDTSQVLAYAPAVGQSRSLGLSQASQWP